MSLLRAAHQLTASIAAAAVLLAALVPALSHAFGAEQRGSWIEVCTVQGSKWVQSGDSRERDSPSAPTAHPFEHCSLCSCPAHAIGIVPAAATVHLISGLGDEVPPTFLTAPSTPHAWVSARPRAPPQQA